MLDSQEPTMSLNNTQAKPLPRKSTRPVVKSRLYEPTAASKAMKRERKVEDGEPKLSWGMNTKARASVA